MTRHGKRILTLTALLTACGGKGSDEATTPAAPEAPAAEPTAVVPATPAEPAPAPEPPAPTYLHGKWVWYELNTGDVGKAKAFYAGLFGWTVEDKEMGGQPYAAIMQGSNEVGLLQAIVSDPKQKAPVGWVGYVSVPDVDAAVAMTTENGGKVHLPAMDMPQVGRFALLTDPQGALFGVVKASAGDDPDVAPAPGAFIWIEHWAKGGKTKLPAEFYAGLAGYALETMKVGKTDYTIGNAAGSGRIGFGPADKKPSRASFVPYVVVADADAAVAKAKELKGKIIQKPLDVAGVGRIAVVSDPTGGTIGVLALPTAPSEPAAPAKPTE